MTRPAVAAEIVVRSAWAKLIVNGSSAEQPSPATANATTPAAASPSDSAAMATNATASTNGSTWYVLRVGNQRWSQAKSTRPTVTIAQNAVRANAATVVDAPISPVISSWDQLPFIVSHSP